MADGVHPMKDIQYLHSGKKRNKYFSMDISQATNTPQTAGAQFSHTYIELDTTSYYQLSVYLTLKSNKQENENLNARKKKKGNKKRKDVS